MIFLPSNLDFDSKGATANEEGFESFFFPSSLILIEIESEKRKHFREKL